MRLHPIKRSPQSGNCPRDPTIERWRQRYSEQKYFSISNLAFDLILNFELYIILFLLFFLDFNYVIEKKENVCIINVNCVREYVNEQRELHILYN